LAVDDDPVVGVVALHEGAGSPDRDGVQHVEQVLR